MEYDFEESAAYEQMARSMERSEGRGSAVQAARDAQRIAALEAENADLRRQLAKSWVPVNGDESERIMCACPDEGCYKSVEWDGTNLTIYVDVSEFDAGLPSLFTMIDLPDNVRLCRRQETQP